jgi:hypothetical protein
LSSSAIWEQVGCSSRAAGGKKHTSMPGEWEVGTVVLRASGPGFKLTSFECHLIMQVY